MATLVQLTVAEANALYKAADYSGRANPKDTIYGLTDSGRALCVARLLSYSDCYLVRHVCTRPEYRHQGLARTLCLAIAHEINKPAWLFPLPELIDLYQRAGFRGMPPDKLPDSLVSVWLASHKKYPQSVPMLAEPTGENA